jgi:Na+-transporting methylmalonyl-CoA/oxaloacetate decarboxylase gamma subunit
MDIDVSNYTIAIVGYVIVFLALVLLYFVFSNLPKLLKVNFKINRKEGDNYVDKYPEFITGQENAAIATAIFLYFSQLHDEESTKLTIKKVKKDYSPWSSRVHTIHTFQRK